MVKLVALFRFKPGMPREEAIAYYEERHVPLANELLAGLLVDYRRNYPLPDRPVAPDHIEATAPDPGFDVVTELWFENESGFQEMLARFAIPEVGSRLAADESNFLDRESMTMFLVDERRSSVTITAGDR